MTVRYIHPLWIVVTLTVTALATVLIIAIVAAHTTAPFHVEDPQVASGEWSIAIQVPPCDKGQLNFRMPERDGDVVTVYCRNMPVKTK